MFAGNDRVLLGWICHYDDPETIDTMISSRFADSSPAANIKNYP